MNTYGHTTFGKHLFSLRAHAHLSQNQLADKSGLSRGQIYKLENGKATNPRIKTLNRLAMALGVVTTDLIVDDHGALD